MRTAVKIRKDIGVVVRDNDTGAVGYGVQLPDRSKVDTV